MEDRAPLNQHYWKVHKPKRTKESNAQSKQSINLYPDFFFKAIDNRSCLHILTLKIQGKIITTHTGSQFGKKSKYIYIYIHIQSKKKIDEEDNLQVKDNINGLIYFSSGLMMKLSED